jgi:hypothetical protein
MEINKYHNSKIYKLISDHTDKIYIGSTFQKFLSVRKAGHKSDYEKFKNNNGSYTTSYELIELGNVDIILIENFKCENKEELHARERYHIELNRELCVNKHIPTRTKKEWIKDNKQHLEEYQKEWNENNKEYVKERSKKYKEYRKEYYNNNKEIIKNKKKEKFNCECGGQFSYSCKSGHLKTKKHLKYINDT